MDKYNTHGYTICVEDISFSVLVQKTHDPAANMAPEILDARTKIMHTHAFTELFACINGDMSINTSSKRIDLCPGDILIIPAGIRHTKLPDSSEWISVGFSFTELKSARNSGLYGRLSRICNAKSTHLIRNDFKLCKDIESALFCSGIYSLDVTALRLLEILLKISETSLYGKSKTSDTKFINVDKDINRLSQLENIFELSFNRDITPSEVAAWLCISERQLSRLVRSRFGASFHSVINDYRITTACQLLTDTELSISSVIDAVGFNSRSVFYSLFCKKIGMTPSEFRAKAK